RSPLPDRPFAEKRTGGRVSAVCCRPCALDLRCTAREGDVMKLHDLTSHARAGHVEEINLISLEGGIYLLEARIDGHSHPLDDGRGHATHLRSVEPAREVLHEFPDMPFHLVHSVVHDEMCGMDADSQDTVRVPISTHVSCWTDGGSEA